MNNRRLTGLLTVILIITSLLSISGCKRTYDLAIGVEGMGTVSPTAGIHQYERDIPVTLKAVPEKGWGFTGWGGPHGKTVIDNSIMMDGSKYITAVFKKLQYQLDITIEPADAGIVEVAIVPASKTVAIEDGQTVRLTAVPNTGYVFGCWNDDPESSNVTLEFLMDAPKTAKAFFVARVAAPEFTPAQGTYNYAQEVALTCATPDAEIRYTTDGITAPSATEGTLYNGTPLQLTQSSVIKAVAYKPGLTDSAVVTRVYTIKAPTPEANLAAGDYYGSQTVTLSTNPANMTIRYTLDGSVPTASHGILYNGPITIDKTLTLKAAAYTANLAVGNMLTRNYSIYNLSSRAPMPTPRKGLAAVAVGGKVYAIGGMNSTGILGSVEAYDPSTNMWETKASMPTARTYLAAAVVDGYIYAIGGKTDSAYWTKTIERYNPLTNTWEPRADAPMSLALCTAVPVNGVIHVVGGGYSIPGNDTFFTGHLDYDPLTDTWLETPISPRDGNEYFRGSSAAAVDQIIYYFGGAYATVWSSDYTRLYDTLSQSWSYGTNVPARCQDAAAAAIGNKVFLIGGIYYFYGSVKQRYDTIRLYNPQINAWVFNFASMSTARYLHAAAVIGESIYIVGGESADGVLAADVIEFGLKR